MQNLRNTEEQKKRRKGKIAEIAVIARNRRNRKSKTLPLINTDHTDLKKRNESLYRGSTQMRADQGISRNVKTAKDCRN
jgi:hypothetical protein